jgi:hypothetical protein
MCVAKLLLNNFLVPNISFQLHNYVKKPLNINIETVKYLIFHKNLLIS